MAVTQRAAAPFARMAAVVSPPLHLLLALGAMPCLLAAPACARMSLEGPSWLASYVWHDFVWCGLAAGGGSSSRQPAMVVAKAKRCCMHCPLQRVPCCLTLGYILGQSSCCSCL